jgi:hypothetical protein
MAARREQLQAANARYQTWAAGTGSSRGNSRESQGRAAAARARPPDSRTAARRAPRRPTGRGAVVAPARRRPHRRRPRPRARAAGRHRRRPALAASAHRTGPDQARRGSRGPRAAAARQVPSGTEPGVRSPHR